MRHCRDRFGDGRELQHMTANSRWWQLKYSVLIEYLYIIGNEERDGTTTIGASSTSTSSSVIQSSFAFFEERKIVTMAACHLRSNSLPSRPHPQTESVEEQLSRLRSSQAASSPISHKLRGLGYLWGCVDELLQLPLLQQSVCSEQNKKWVEAVLDGSLHLLEACCAARDGFASVRESTGALRSTLWRKRNGECVLASEIESYMMIRKKMNRAIKKSIKNLANAKKDSNMESVIGLVKEAQEASVQVFESLLVPGCRSRSFVSNLLQPKRKPSQQVATSELERLDADLLALKSKKEVDSFQVQKVLKGLEGLEGTIQEAEEELESIYRQLLKVRVSILNVLSH